MVGLDSIAESDTHADVMEMNLIGPTPMHADWCPHIETYFDNDELGRLRSSDYALNGSCRLYSTKSRQHGRGRGGRNEMKMELTIPATSPQAIEANDSLYARMTRVAPPRAQIATHCLQIQETLITTESPTEKARYSQR